MNRFTATMLLDLMKLITSGALMDHIVELVSGVMNLKTTGDEKRRAVMLALGNVGDDLQPLVAEAAGYMLNLSVEAAVAYVKAHEAV